MTTKFYKDKGGRECSSCHTYKSWDLYTISKYSKLGYSSSCKACGAKVKEDLRKTKCNKQKEVTSGLLTTKHEVKIEVPYWDNSNFVEYGGYHPIIKTKIG